MTRPIATAAVSAVETTTDFSLEGRVGQAEPEQRQHHRTRVGKPLQNDRAEHRGACHAIFPPHEVGPEQLAEPQGRRLFTV